MYLYNIYFDILKGRNWENADILKGDLHKLHSKKVLLLGKNDVFS
jgi:hypothetical protein